MVSNNLLSYNLIVMNLKEIELIYVTRGLRRL